MRDGQRAPLIQVGGVRTTLLSRRLKALQRTNRTAVTAVGFF